MDQATISRVYMSLRAGRYAEAINAIDKATRPPLERGPFGIEEVEAETFSRRLFVAMIRGNREHAVAIIDEAFRPRIAEAVTLEEKRRIPLADLLDVRICNYLETINVFTVGELLEIRRTDLLRIPNFGQHSLDVVLEKLAELGFKRESRTTKQPK